MDLCLYRVFSIVVRKIVQFCPHRNIVETSYVVIYNKVSNIINNRL